MGRSEVHPNSKAFGEPIKYDPDFNGPQRRRSCTDIICLLLFVIFMGCWIAVGTYALLKGDPNSLLIPQDSYKRRCGHDSGVRDKPYLYFIDIKQCLNPTVLVTGCNTKQICVKECPKKFFVYNKSTTRKDLICDENVDDTTDIDTAMKNGDCSQWYVNSIPVMNRCLPVVEDAVSHITELSKYINISEIQEAIKNIKFLAKAEEMVAMVTEDIINSWWQILLGILGSLIVCIMYILIMRWVASVVVWFSIFGVIAVLSFGIYASYTKYDELKNKKVELEFNWDNILAQKDVWLAILIIASILLAITLLILIFLRKRIVIAIALIKEGSKAVGANTSSLFFPILPWVFQIIVLVFAIMSGLYLASIGEIVYKVKGSENCSFCSNYKIGDICDPKEFEAKCYKLLKSTSCKNISCAIDVLQNPTHIKFFHAVNIIGGFWGIFFVTAFGEMVLATTFATWYWTFKKSDVPFFTVTHSIYRTLRYHIGTLAFGSLIITICRLIRIAIEYIDHKLKKYDNQCVKAVLCCCKCFFWCLETFLKFINKNAYIMCAIHGKNFCCSAKDAFNLLMRNILRVFVLDKVTDLLFFLGKILITMSVALVAYTAIVHSKLVELHYELVPVIFISIGAFLISCIFFGVYSMAVDTLFLCFLEDCERNDGSQDKPYYMSRELMKILGKKNKKNKNKNK